MNMSEQAMISPEAETAERKQGIAGFENPEALAEAYKSLQAEFTRRSQKLKQAERQIEALKQEAESVLNQPEDHEEKVDKKENQETMESEFESFLRQFPEANAEAVLKGAVSAGDFKSGNFTREYVRSLKAEIDRLNAENVSEDEIAKKALASGKVTEAVVKEYLKAVMVSSQSAQPIVSGTAPVTPPSKPKTIKEAGKLAGDYFKI